jgi:hypothetical protein
VGVDDIGDSSFKTRAVGGGARNRTDCCVRSGSGAGANTAVYSFMQALLLRALV